ncbi:MAG: flagellar hook assembly protein FlgD [Desulfobaccales bacterium]
MGDLATAATVVNTLNQETSSTAAATTSSSSGSLTSSVQTNMGKEDFLKLLVTQLRYQDPLNPEDPKDFVAQLAQFSSLEQQINANKNLEEMGELFKSLQSSQSMTQGIALLGKTVKGSGNLINVANGKVGEVSFNLPQEAQEVVVGIFDASGNQVRILNLGSQAAGLSPLSWDGKDSQGKAVSDGIYSYQIAAKDKTGKAIQVDSYFTGKVEEVYQDSQGVWVKVNGRQVLLSNITSVLGEGL